MKYMFLLTVFSFFFLDEIQAIPNNCYRPHESRPVATVPSLKKASADTIIKACNAQHPLECNNQCTNIPPKKQNNKEKINMFRNAKIFILTAFSFYALGMVIGNESATAYERQRCVERRDLCLSGGPGCEYWKEFPFAPEDKTLRLEPNDFFNNCKRHGWDSGCRTAYYSCCVNSNDENNCK